MKRENITSEKIREFLENAGHDAGYYAKDYADRVEKGYCEGIPDPCALAQTALSISRNFADLAATIVFRGALEEYRHEIDKRLRERTGTS